MSIILRVGQASCNFSSGLLNTSSISHGLRGSLSRCGIGKIGPICNKGSLGRLHIAKFPVTKQECRNRTSVILKLLLGGGTIYGLKTLSLSTVAYCEAVKTATLEPPSHSRTDGTQENVDEEDPPFDWLFFWKLLQPQLHFFIAAMGSALVVALCNIQIPISLGSIVNVVAQLAQETSNQGESFMKEVANPALKLLKLYLVQAIFTFSYITFLTRMGERIAVDLRQELFASLLKQDISFYDQHKTGELVNRLTSDVQDFKSSFKMCVSQGLRSCTQVIGCGISLFMISPQMAGLTAIVVPAVIVIGTGLGSLLRSLSKAAQQQVAIATGVADECLGNIRTVRAFAMEEAEKDLFKRELQKSTDINEALGFGIGLFQAGSNLFLNAIVTGTLFAGGSLMATGQLQAGDLMSFLVAAQTIQRSLGQMSVLFGYFVRGISAGARVIEYVKREPIIPLTGGKIIPSEDIKGKVEFADVTFSYPTRSDQEVLHQFNLNIPAGTTMAIVGASGGGKSTLAQLLERFYDVNSGSISIDGVDIRELDPSWLRGKICGFINQEPVLFHTSVIENIRYGRPEATDEQVIEAAKLANAHEFIQKFSAGYDTIVGERGLAVSGGQKQRIAIARALLKDPKILILDEATSALDAESEAVVQAALEKCIEGRTVIVIAHRLSTIKNAHCIAVMSHGKLAEIGTHESLKNLHGIYAELIRQQQSESKFEGA
ncbi:unnamed protein product [Meganyctiphanes norvegica]|uniref:Mitochondrial potassium channel ATP-binding subunit n=1 Tax=Meganyctiphanes norvegica TaxID=48144 RepID=A0AAV2RG33_MEGNR